MSTESTLTAIALDAGWDAVREIDIELTALDARLTIEFSVAWDRYSETFELECQWELVEASGYDTSESFFVGARSNREVIAGVLSEAQRILRDREEGK